ncbi:YdcF family protein [Aquincola sp. S2]|uniref:YdcF family protein n=1 Tax=Pseudaquabacterium terrae TaxID=2732868 RepID=A0ABX2EQI2_9BURK|nr:YdcF family protein [Aquabacterium terrae]NRF70896.1 YdcF family protein [Aquabacterium terrae]
MDSLLATLGWVHVKPLLTALALPPVPLLLLVLIGARRSARHGGRLLLVLALILLWFSCTMVLGSALERWLLNPPPALTEARIAALKPAAARRLAVVVLGGGRERLAPEYGEAHLAPRSMQRLHYGLWLARRLDAPLMFSGGTGLAQSEGAAEADIAARIAERDYGRKLRWTENGSRDTRENAAAGLSMLAGAGITEVVLVTHDWHMRRAQRAFVEAAQRNRHAVQITAAPMGGALSDDRPVLRWLPSAEGFAQVRHVLREALGLLMGA